MVQFYGKRQAKWNIISKIAGVVLLVVIIAIAVAVQ